MGISTQSWPTIRKSRISRPMKKRIFQALPVRNPRYYTQGSSNTRGRTYQDVKKAATW